MAAFAIDQKMIDRATELVPDEDLVAACRDCDSYTKATDLLLVLSTPRFGSTLLCDLTDRTGLCCPAEYVQLYECLPLLAPRWNCLRNGALDEVEFCQKLKQDRTSETGWPGVKLHPTHRSLFERARPQSDALRRYGIHLVRRDQIAQAMSFHKANQTNRWSSAFRSCGKAKYDHAAIRHLLHEIIKGNAFLLAVIAACKLRVERIASRYPWQRASWDLAKIYAGLGVAC